MFKISYTRETLIHEDHACRIRVVLDRGSIFIGSKGTPINELELILEKGTEYDRFMMAGWLESNYTIEPIQGSKAERGFLFRNKLADDGEIAIGRGP